MAVWEPLSLQLEEKKSHPQFYCAKLWLQLLCQPSSLRASSKCCGSFPWGWWLGSRSNGRLLERQLGFLLAIGEVAAASTPLRVVVNFPDGLLLAHCADKQNPALLERFGRAGQAVALQVKCMQGFTESFIATALPLPKSLLWSFGTCLWS